MSTVDAKIIAAINKHMNNGTMSAPTPSEPVVSPTVEFEKISSFTEIDVENNKFKLLDNHELMIGDILRFKKKDAVETIDFTISSVSFLSGGKMLYETSLDDIQSPILGMEEQSCEILFDANDETYEIRLENNNIEFESSVLELGLFRVMSGEKHNDLATYTANNFRSVSTTINNLNETISIVESQMKELASGSNSISTTINLVATFGESKIEDDKTYYKLDGYSIERAIKIGDIFRFLKKGTTEIVNFYVNNIVFDKSLPYSTIYELRDENNPDEVIGIGINAFSDPITTKSEQYFSFLNGSELFEIPSTTLGQGYYTVQLDTSNSSSGIQYISQTLETFNIWWSKYMPQIENLLVVVPKLEDKIAELHPEE